jgi:hypothetical protein
MRAWRIVSMFSMVRAFVLFQTGDGVVDKA